MGTSGATLGRIGCLVTSISMLIAKSGVPTNNVGASFNPGTFVKALNKVGGIDGNGNLSWYSVEKVVPKFQYVGNANVRGKTQAEKIKIAKNLTSQGYYLVAEVKGATEDNQHWVAVDKVLDNSIIIMDPGYGKTKLWDSFYPVNKTTQFAYFKAA